MKYQFYIMLNFINSYLKIKINFIMRFCVIKKLNPILKIFIETFLLQIYTYIVIRIKIKCINIK